MGQAPLRQELGITRRALRGPSAPRAEFGVLGACFFSRFWELELVCVSGSGLYGLYTCLEFFME